MKKRFLAMLMVVLLIVNIIPTSIVAADEDTPAEVIYGSYDSEGNWIAGGPDTVTDESGISVTKKAEPTANENEYKITLQIETSTTTSTVAASAATVLVIDVSGSMDYCANCGDENHCDHCTYSGWQETNHRTSRITAAKSAAISFLKSYCDAPAGSGRYVSIVRFSRNGTVAQDWIDVSGGTENNTNYNTVVGVINGLSANGGTNLDDGLYNANAQFNKSAVSGITNKFTVALTDGAPTYSRNGGTGNAGSAAINNATAATATTLRNNATVYTVCFGVANDTCYNGGPTVGTFLADSVATSGCAYNADNASQLYSAFASITEDITSGLLLSGSTVTDPMGDEVVSFSVTDNLPDGNGFIWTLSDAEPSVSTDAAGNTVKTYVYTLTYTVTLGANGTEPSADGYFPLNGSTYLTIDEDTVIQFPIPAVSPRYTVIYDNGDHGTLAGEDDNGQILTTNLARYEDTPAAPAVTPDDDYYFIGWDKTIAAEVTESVTYTAQYAKKTEITLTGASDTKTYNGSEQSVDTFTVSGLPEGCTLSNVTYKASGTEVGSYPGVFTGTPVIMKGEENVTQQFKITQQTGTLTITPLDVTVTIVGNTDSQTYNGTEQKVTGYTATDNSDLYSEADFTFSGDATAKGTNVGTYPMGLDVSQFTNNNSNFTVTFQVTDGSLEITKRSVTLTSDTANKIYDGTPLKAESVEETGDGFVEGEGADYSNFAEITNVGSTENTFEYNLKDGTSADNYSITVVNGTLTVNADTDATISITPYTGMYDGETHDALTSVVLKNGDGEEISTDGWTITYVVDGKEYTEMPTIKDVGTLPVTVKASNANYKDLEATATAEVTPRKVTLTSASAQKEYDGQPLTAETVAVIGDGFVAGEGAAYSDFASITDVGEIDNSFTYTLNEGTNAANYEITVVEGTLEVVAKPAKITITADSNSKVYDGTPLTDDGYTFTENVLEDGDVLTVVVEGTITDAGSVANVVTSYKVMRGDVDVTGNYTFAESVDGTLTVTKRPVTLTSETASKVYDGTPLTDDTVTANGFVDGEGATYTVTGTQTNVGSSANTFTYTLNEGTNADNYDITKVEGTLTVTPLTGVVVTITENSDTKVYNGAEQQVTGYTVKSISNNLYTEDDFIFYGEAVAQGTNVGTYDMSVTADMFANMNSNFSEVTFVIEDGQLEITPLEGVVVIITENSDTKVYTGAEQQVTGYTVTSINSNLYTEADFSFSGEAVAKGTTVGTYDMGVTADMFTNTNDNFKDVTFIIVDGTLKITPITTELVITADSNSKVYDGTALTDDGYTYTENVLANGDVLTAVVKGTITDVGSVANTVTSWKIMRGDVDVTACYSNIKTVDGTLTVTKRSVTLTSATDSKTYDGTALTNDEITVSGDGFAAGEGAAYNVTGSQTLAGTSDNTFTYTLNEGTKAENYNIEKVYGTLTVSPVGEVIVTITEHSGTYTYDGTEKTVTGYDVSISDPLYTEEDFEFSGTASVSGIYVGTYAMELTPEDFTNIDTVNFEKVTFVIVDGTLVIDPIEAEIIITADSNSKVYDGEALTDDGYTYTQGVLMDGDVLTAVVEGTITDVGSVANKVTSWKIMRGDVDVTSCYTGVKAEDGTLTVTKRPVTLTSATDSKVYDGTPLTNDEITVSGDGFAAGESATYDVTGSQTYVGSSANTFTYTLSEGTKAENYDITIIEGTLTVSRLGEVIVTITENSGEYTYDGTEKTVTGYTVSISNKLYTEADFSFVGNASVSGTYVGTYNMELKASDFANINDNFENVIFVIVDGTLVIKPIETELIITADSNTKVYDGEALTDVGYTYTDGVLMNGDELTAIVEGTITDVGSVANTVTSWKIMRGDVDVTACYTGVKTVDGTLTVTKRPVTLTSATDSKTYDGTPLTNSEVTVSGDGFAAGEGASYDVTGSQTDAGSSNNTFTYTLNEDTKAENYDITTIEGTLTVAPIGEVIVTITENSGVYTYDGTEKVVEGYTVSISDPLYTEEDFEFSGTASVSGIYVGTYDMELTPEDFTNLDTVNFEKVTFVIVDGTLTINPIEAEIIITADSNEKIYDGEALTDDGFTFTNGILLDGDVLTAVVEGTITDVGSVVNTVTSWNVMRGDVDVTDCYTFGESVDGSLTVTPRELVITSGSDTKVYDGTPLTNNDITTEGFVEGEGAIVTVTGSQLNAGTSENTFTYTFAENTKAENYTVVIVNGTLEVTPKAVTITSGSASKNYDGEPLTCDKITAEGFVEGEGAEYTITGSQTEVGTGKNSFTYKLNKNTLAENYVITLVEGDLVVEPPIDSPDTGDNTNLALCISLMCTSAAAFMYMLFIAGKKKDKYSA